MKRAIRQLRIVGGSLRGRRWQFADDPAIRPTPDRVRETLFNWLQPIIHGARCLDLFAGSGALGLEALSRGASQVLFVDRSGPAVAALRAVVEKFAVEGARFQIDDAVQAVRGAGGPWDVVFLDPPFAAGLVTGTLNALSRAGVLARGAMVYLEVPAKDPLPSLPAGWAVHRQGRAGEVGYYLFSTASQVTP
jgi:16S rRNA (guanine966-N2)-methyltransferase